MPNPAFDSRYASEDMDGTQTAGDGDTGDGDTGDGDTGDGDVDTGDGDGDTGDGDTGDGDGDTGNACPPNQTDCEGECVMLDSDPFNCGICGHECELEEFCEGGMCHGERVVFVTSQLGPVDFGGVGGANEICNQLAAQVDLEGDFKAWLGDQQGDPASTFTKAGWFVLVDGTLIADDWADLTDGTLDAPIKLDEMGEAGNGPPSCLPEGVAVRTGLSVTGQTLADNCDDWTDPDGSALTGYLNFNDQSWTASDCPHACASPMAFYCFEQ